MTRITATFVPGRSVIPRGRAARRFATCAIVPVAAFGLSVPVASAQNSPTTPVPAPADPNQPPAAEPPAVPEPGPISAEAGTGFGVVRILPKTVPGDSILDDDPVPKQSVAELGMGLATAQANSSAYLSQEKAIAESAPTGFALGGKSPQVPGSLNQMAVPDHQKPTTGGLRPPPSPADQLLKLGALEGSTHARWDKRLGPCVEPIADARTSLGSASAINALPALPEPAGIGGPAQQRLGSLLNGGLPTADGHGSFLHIPDPMQAHSNVRLVDVPGQPGKAVQSTSTLQAGSIQLFAGTPQELQIDVVGLPRLTATSTGTPETSTVDYQAPVLRISQGGNEIGRLDAAHPELDLPIPGPESPRELPGNFADPRTLDLGVLRMSIGAPHQNITAGAVKAGAQLFDLKVLPGDAVHSPAALADISFGEQAVKAGAPAGGVRCDRAEPVPAAGSAPPAPPTGLTGSGHSPAMPLLWAGTTILLVGSLVLTLLPPNRRAFILDATWRSWLQRRRAA